MLESIIMNLTILLKNKRFRSEHKRKKKSTIKLMLSLINKILKKNSPELNHFMANKLSGSHLSIKSWSLS